MELNLGFFKQEKEEVKELFDVPFITLEKRTPSTTKVYSTFKLSNSAMELLGFKKISNQVIGIAEPKKNEFILINTTDFRTPSDANNFQLSKLGTFSSGNLYNKIIENLEVDDSKDTYLGIIGLDNITVKTGDDSFEALAVKILPIYPEIEENITDDLIEEEITEDSDEFFPED